MAGRLGERALSWQHQQFRGRLARVRAQYRGVVCAGGATAAGCSCPILRGVEAQESSVALARRFRYVQPRLLCIDEVGYLSYDNRYPTFSTTWSPRAMTGRALLCSAPTSRSRSGPKSPRTLPAPPCTLTLIDRLLHRTEIIDIAGDSYRQGGQGSRRPKRPRLAPRRGLASTSCTAPKNRARSPSSAPGLRGFSQPATVVAPSRNFSPYTVVGAAFSGASCAIASLN
jgi:IstB-like ATP binding protein